MRRLALLLPLAACGGHHATVKPAGAGSGSATPPPAAKGPPVAAKRPVTDTYFGVAVADPYQWLEADDDEVKAWSAGQNAYARGILDHLPHVDDLRKEIHDIVAAPITQYFGLQPGGKKLFGFRKLPDKEQPELIAMDDPDKADQATSILDPAAQGGAQESIDWFVPSLDGTKVAVSISEGGSEAGTLHVLGEDGKELDTPIPDVQHGTGGGDVAWDCKGDGFYYTRYPRAGEPHADEPEAWMQVWHHTIGDKPEKDQYVLGKDLPKIAEIGLESDCDHVLVTVQNGDSNTFRHYVKLAKGDFQQLDDWNDGIATITYAGGKLYEVSRKGTPRGVIIVVDPKPKAKPKLLVPEGKDAIVTSFPDEHDLLIAGGKIYVRFQTGGPSEIRAFDQKGKAAKGPEVPAVSSVGEPVPWAGGFLFGVGSYTRPFATDLYDAKTGKVTEVAALSPKPPVDLSKLEVHREMATSKDGTPVPVNIVWPAGAPKDGSTPCIVYGYGGFGISEEPGFLGALAPLLQRGICWVDVNIRGGAEFGDDWHTSGAMTHKQNGFDDFAAAITYVIDQKYSSTPKLAIMGGSNGGLLMGAMITQHPDLVHAVVAEVGIYDMLRNELTPNGKYNIVEYGTVTNQDQFKALYAYSPYHHVVAGTKYPAILMTTGANDPRVAPWQSRKMVAALQAAQAGDAPILLRTSDKAGHGFGSSMTERIELLAHVEAFLLWQLTGS